MLCYSPQALTHGVGVLCLSVRLYVSRFLSNTEVLTYFFFSHACPTACFCSAFVSVSVSVSVSVECWKFFNSGIRGLACLIYKYSLARWFAGDYGVFFSLCRMQIDSFIIIIIIIIIIITRMKIA